MSREDFGHFGRRGRDSDDFDKLRDEFFTDNWPRDASRPMFTSGPRSSFSGFPGGGLRREFGDFGGLPAQRPLDDDLRPGGGGVRSSSFSGHADSIPISVIHERTPASPAGNKYKYSGGAQRNTTELPAAPKSKSSGDGSSSPRLERAHSEPPHKFNQRLNIPRPSPYSTIPENSEGSNITRGGGGGADGGGAGVSSQNNPIKTSASAPSVPDSRGDHHQPIPPPRKSPAKPASMNLSGSSSSNMNAVPTSGANNVRHIPIFVEGRPEPIFNTNLNTPSAATADPTDSMPFRKPSEFYPPGVQRIRSRDDSEPVPETPTPSQQQQQTPPPPPPLSVRKVPVQEPTTPQGPPPGPIPMGYFPPPQHTVVAEPTTPQGPPPGPIPMGYVPSQLETEPTSPLPALPNQPIPLPCHPGIARPNGDEPDAARPAPPSPPVPPTRNATSAIHLPPLETGNPQPEPPKMQKSSLASKPEPVVNIVPIRVDPGRASTVADGSKSRQSSPKPDVSQNPRGPSPNPVAEEEITKEAKTETDPRIQKLETLNAEAESLCTRIDKFEGSKKDKEYLYLDDILTKLLISADNISTDGIGEIRQQRKDCCNKINKLADLLEKKASKSS